MNEELDLFDLIARAELVKKEYDKLLKSGLFWEFYPQLSGEWEKDELEWNRIYEDMNGKYGK